MYNFENPKRAGLRLKVLTSGSQLLRLKNLKPARQQFSKLSATVII
jgi:hypothetical protein